MININKIAKSQVSPEVVDFMDTYGGNHVSLYKGWRERPEMKESSILLESQLAYAIQNINYGVAKRLLGRLRKIDTTMEDATLKKLLNAYVPPVADCLL